MGNVNPSFVFFFWMIQNTKIRVHRMYVCISLSFSVSLHHLISLRSMLVERNREPVMSLICKFYLHFAFWAHTPIEILAPWHIVAYPWLNDVFYRIGTVCVFVLLICIIRYCIDCGASCCAKYTIHNTIHKKKGLNSKSIKSIWMNDANFVVQYNAH